MKLSLVVPCFNEEHNIIPFYDACKEIFFDIFDNVELIFINDGSSDDTWGKIKQLYKQNSSIKGINLSRNFGKESAIYAGLQEAIGEYVTIIDADLQQHPRYVKDMVLFLDEHPEYDVVATYQDQRIEPKMISFFKSMFYKSINLVSDIKFHPNSSDFRTLRSSVVKSVLQLKEYFRFSKGLFTWVGYKTYYMSYHVEKRNAGNTSWSFSKLCKYALEGIMAFSTAPLNLAVYLGFLFSFLSLLYMVVVIIQKITFGIEISGYPTLVTLILFLGGIQMILLGIIGQYISKIYIEGKKRPIYIVREVIKNEENS